MTFQVEDICVYITAHINEAISLALVRALLENSWVSLHKHEVNLSGG